MKKTLFLSLILSCLCGLTARGEYTLDTAVGSYYFDSSTNSWGGNNITATQNANGGLTLTSTNGNFGNGRNITVAITFNASEVMESVTAANDSLILFDIAGWGVGVKADGTVSGTWNANFDYASTSPIFSLNGQEGLVTLVVTMDDTYGTAIMDGSTSMRYQRKIKGDVLNSDTLTINSDYLVGIATWNTTTSSFLSNRIDALNSLSKVTGGNTISYPDAFVKTRTDGTSLGRILFMGDSITHGIQDATWRWQFFKILVDNGMEFEIGGPRSGEASTPLTSDFTAGSASYGGVDYADLHYARSSGRTYNMLGNNSRGQSYEYDKGGTLDVNSASLLTNADTHFLLIGTNDLLSDTDRDTTAAQYATIMQNLLGGTVTYADDTYTWTAGDSAGNMGQIADTVLKDDTDTLYIFSIPTWGTGNSNHPGTGQNPDTVAYDAVHQYNGLLENWVKEYNKTSAGTAYYVDINRGLLDVTKDQWIGCNDFFRTTSSDYLHPNEQGSLIIAGNLAKGMGLAGRTAGQHRLGIEDFIGRSESPVAVTSSTSYTLSDCFGKGEAYTLSLDLTFGNGATGGWSTTDSFTITSGNGTVGGTLSISEGFIKWGSKTLFSLDMSQNTDTLRIAYVMEDALTSNTGGGVLCVAG